MDIHEMLRTIQNAGYSQAKIAEIIGVKQPTVCRYLTGEFTTMKHPVYFATEKLYKKVKRVS